MSNEVLFAKLAIALLDDDDGISEDAYKALLDLGENIRPELCLHLNRAIDCNNGRYFLHADWRKTLPPLWRELP